MAGTDTGMKWLKRQIDKLPQGSRYSGEGIITPNFAEQSGGASWRSKIEDNMRETPKDKEDTLKESLNRADINQEIQNARAQGKKKGGKIKSSASKRADGCIEKGHTRGRYL